MGFLKSIFGETTEKKTERWKTELKEILEQVLENEDCEFAEDDSTLILRVGDVFLQIDFEFTDEDKEENCYDHVSITCPLVYLPDKNILPFYRKLLDLNAELYGTLSTEGNTVCLSRVTAIESLTKEEVGIDVIEILGELETVASLLIDEFQVQRYEYDSEE